MTKAVLTYIDKSEETIECNYTKTREGWLEIAVTTDKPHRRVFIPAHMLSKVTTTDYGGDDGGRFFSREKGD